MDGGELVERKTGVARGDASEVSETAEHALDGVFAPMEVARETDLPDSLRLGRDVRLRAFGRNGATDAVAVIAPVSVQFQRFGRRSSSIEAVVQSSTWPPASKKAIA